MLLLAQLHDQQTTNAAVAVGEWCQFSNTGTCKDYGVVDVTGACCATAGVSTQGADVVTEGVSVQDADTENQGGKTDQAAPARWRFTEPSTADFYFGLRPMAASARACILRDRGKEGYKYRDVEYSAEKKT